MSKAGFKVLGVNDIITYSELATITRPWLKDGQAEKVAHAANVCMLSSGT